MPGRIAVKGGQVASVLALVGKQPGKRGVRAGKAKTVLAHKKTVLLRGLRRKGR